jgi:arylsulfatase A-like enzyme
MTRERPNIVFILTDDQGPWAAGCYGNKELRTPNIDRIAATGMRFDSFFCASPVCSPSRASFLTGLMPSAHGVHDWIRGGNYGDDAATYLTGQTGYTDLLAQAGWSCGISGKWHLGNSVLPQHGFSHWFVHEKGGGPYNDAPMIRNGERFNAPGYVTSVITDDALGFIDRHAGSAAPFYLSVHYTAPHSPWTGHPQAIVDSYDDCPFASCPQEEAHPWAGSLTRNCLGDREMLKGYFAAVTAMDRDVGRILERLEQHGIRQRTLVVFTSDNGFSCGHHGFWGKGNGTFPLNMYENSVKVPFLVSQPGRVPAGRVVGEMLSAIDLMPTLLAYTGVDLPEALRRGRAGRSFAELLEGGTAPARDRVVIYDEYGATRMIRTAEWKYVQRYPAAGGREGPNELYDLVNDPDERANRAYDPEQQRRIRELRGMLESWFAEQATAEHDGRNLPVAGGGQLRPVGGTWEDGSPAFVAH